MKILLWKEWREQRLFFFISIGLVVLLRMIFIIFLFLNKGKEYIEYLDYANPSAHFVLPILFSLLFGTLPFTNEFIKNTKSFLLTHPVTSAKIFWVKYLSGLVLLLTLVLFSHLVFNVPFVNPLSDKQLPILYLFLYTTVLYSAACFSSLALKNSLPAIIITPFILLLILLLISPLFAILYLIIPFKCFIPICFILLGIVPVFYCFIIWQKAITKTASVTKVFITVTVVTFVFSFGIHAVINLLASRHLNKAFRQAREAGIKTTPAEIIPPAVPDEDNAALVLEQAFESIDKLKEKFKTEWKYMPYESITPIEELTSAQKEKISRIMQDSEFVRFFALIDQAVNMTACRFDNKYEEGPSALFPRLAPMRELARIILARTYILSEERRYSEALQTAKTVLHLGDFITNEPIFISQLTRIGLDTTAIRSLKLLFDNQKVIISFKEYQELLSIINRKDRLITRGLEGELVFCGGYIFKQPAYSSDWNTYYGSVSFSPSPISNRNLYHYIIGPILKEDYAFYIRFFSKLIDYSQRPYFLVKERVAEWNRENLPNFRVIRHPLSTMLLPGMSSTLIQQANYNATLDSFKLALALRIYREKHGNYPDNLSALAPEIISELPFDTFNGKDYIYRREGKGFIVYSVGPNEKDDGGINDSKQKQDDISFKVTN